MKPVSRCKRSGWLALAGGLALISSAASAETGYRASFDQDRYVVEEGATFEVRVLVSPPPPPGMFSFGVRLGFPSANAEIVGVQSVQPVTELSFDGPRVPQAVIGFGPGFAAAKGTAEFFSATRPVSTNAVLVTFLLRDRGGESYGLSLDFFNTLGPTEQIFVTGQGQVLDPDLKFGAAMVVRGGNLLAAAAAPLAFNRQTGLFQQTVRVTNGTPRPVSGVRLLVSNFPAAWQVWNAQGTTNGNPFLLYNNALPSGEHVDLRVEFRIPDRNPTVQPDYLAEAIMPPGPTEPPTGASFVLSPRAQLPDGAFLIEFNSLSNRSYAIQYSRDLSNWNTVAPTIPGNGSRVQWTDYGPPKTDRPPAQEANRYYRVFLLP